MDSLVSNSGPRAQMPYSNCITRVIDLEALQLPASATDEQYRNIYNCYIKTSTENARNLRDAIESVKYGIAPPVAFPTETVYGLGADATNEPAVSGIFAAKGRPSDNPLIVHAASLTHLESLTGEPIPDVYRALVQKFWPGPLTILIPVPKPSAFAKNIHPGQHTIGFRVPESKYARFFIAAADRPIAGPSANSSGKPSPTTAQHVLDDLNGKINFVLDGGSCHVGVESTVVDGLHDPPLILRPGGVSQQELIEHGRQFGNKWSQTAIGYKRHETVPSTPSYDMDMNGAPRAPGMKYRHYAPKARLILFTEGAVTRGGVHDKLTSLMSSTSATPLKIGVLSCHWPEFAGLPVSQSNSRHKGRGLYDSTWNDRLSTASYHASGAKHTIYNIDIGSNSTELAHDLFGVLRLFDDLGCDFILAEAVDRCRCGQDQKVVDAVADRIDKAAAERVDE